MKQKYLLDTCICAYWLRDKQNVSTDRELDRQGATAVAPPPAPPKNKYPPRHPQGVPAFLYPFRLKYRRRATKKFKN